MPFSAPKKERFYPLTFALLYARTRWDVRRRIFCSIARMPMWPPHH
jgi:hypothetical protein